MWRDLSSRVVPGEKENWTQVDLLKGAAVRLRRDGSQDVRTATEASSFPIQNMPLKSSLLPSGQAGEGHYERRVEWEEGIESRGLRRGAGPKAVRKTTNCFLPSPRIHKTGAC